LREFLATLDPGGLLDLYWLIATNRAEFRVYRKPKGYFHAKLYLFEIPVGRSGDSFMTLSIVGSGNFSAQAFLDNTELNVFISQPDQARKLKDWFEERWEEAEPYAPELLEIVEKEYKRRTGEAPPPPPDLRVKAPSRTMEGEAISIDVAWQRVKNIRLQEAIEEEEWREIAQHEGEVRGQGTWDQVAELERPGLHYLRVVGEDSKGTEVYSPVIAVEVMERPEVVSEVTPFDFYAVTLWKLFEDQAEIILKDIALRAGEREEEFLNAWQRDAVAMVWDDLERYGGAILADTVGAGKTSPGAEIGRRFQHMYGGETILVIVPAVLRRHWIRHLEQAGIAASVTLLSHEAMGRREFDPHQYVGLSLIIVDEAHRFRTRTANRYKALTELHKLNPEARILFITATPINNTVYDLHSLLRFFLRDSAFIDKGVESLMRVFRDFDSTDEEAKTKARDDLRKVLEEVATKRTRKYLRDNYPGEYKDKFPESRILQTATYHMSSAQKKALDKLAVAFERLRFPQYRIAAYKKALTPEEKSELMERGQVVPFIEKALLKRFESSGKALLTSLQHQRDLLDAVVRYLEGVGQPAEARLAAQDEELEVFTQKMWEELCDLAADPERYQLDGLRKDVESDSAIIDELLMLTQRFDEVEEDPKFKELMDLVHELQEKNKILIFTQFIDTAKYLQEGLSQSGVMSLALLTGETEDKEDVVARFAPISPWWPF